MNDVRCGTCKWWDIEKAKDKRGVVRKGKVAMCLWPIPILPASKGGFTSIWLTYMGKDYGTDCQCWEERVHEGEKAEMLVR